MNFLLFTIVIAGSTACCVILQLFTTIVYTWQRTRWLKESGVEAEARILQVKVINEPGRYLPFVKLKVAVMPAHGNHFITSIESVFPPAQLPGLTTDGSITIRYNPANISQLEVVRREKTVQEIEKTRWQPVSAKGYLSMVQ